MPILDWNPRYDETSKDYPAIRTAVTRPLFTKIYDCPFWLDQGEEGACVGFGHSHKSCAGPNVHPKTESDAFALYRRAQQIDEWEGENYSGTSVLAGAKAAKEAGWILEYRWCFSVEEILQTLCYIGPVVLGLWWYEGMWDTDAAGYIRPTGGRVGGHCLLALGYDHENQRVLLHNSWGPGWGENGRAWISVADLKQLFEVEDGEACVTVEPAPTQPAPEGPTDESTDVVVEYPFRGFKSSKVVHKSTHLYKNRTMELGWMTLAEARAAGRKPCAICKPR